MIHRFYRPYLLMLGIFSSSAFGFFIDGEGYYAIRPESLTNPGASSNRGLRQGTLQSFGLLGRARATDNLTFNLQFRLFEDPRTAYFGDTAEPEECSPTQNAPGRDGGTSENSNRGSTSNCSGRHQDTMQPAYAPLRPFVTEAYGRYGFEYCLLEFGRKGRDWGRGIFLDSGRDPFESSASIFDGVACHLNLTNTQVLGFSFGIDKLAETGTNLDVGMPRPSDQKYGITKSSDDLNQIYFTIEYNNLETGNASDFRRQVGIYFANVFGGEQLILPKDVHINAESDVKFADIYTKFEYGSFSFDNELFFRMGKSADPSWSRYGGRSSEAEVTKNTVNAIGLAGELAIDFGKSGSVIGPPEMRRGDLSSHSLFLEYAYAPGDADGFKQEYGLNDKSTRSNLRDDRAKAMAFHRNYKPALIMFNDRADLDDLRVDGIFDPSRFMNASLLAGGYRLKSNKYGDVDFKLIYAKLNEVATGQVKADIISENGDKMDNPIGTYGKHLGYELDVEYSRVFNGNVKIGGAAAMALPGTAWKVSEKSSPATSFLLQGQLAIYF